MKKLFYLYGIIIVIFVVVCSIVVGYKKDNNNTILQKDTISINDTIHDTITITLMIHDTAMIKKVDSLSTELFIANYKLNRIKEYNRIAAKGNNIKYLRGWINRVIE